MKDRQPQLIGILILLILGIFVCMLGALITDGDASRGSASLGFTSRGTRVPVASLFPITYLGGLAALALIPDPKSWRMVGGILLIVAAAGVATLVSGVASTVVACIVPLPILIGAAYLLYQSTGVH